MNELFPNAKALLTWTFGIIGTLLGLLGVIAMAFVRSYMKANYVTKEDLAVMREELSEERARQHSEGQRKLDSIQNAVTGTHQRLDQLYRDLINRGDR